MSIYYVTAAVSNVNVNTVGVPNDPESAYGIQAALDNSAAGDIVAIKSDCQYDITATIDIDTGGGSALNGTFKIIEGYLNTFGDGGRAVFDGGGGNFHLFKINDISNVIVRNIYGKNVHESWKYIFYVTRTAGTIENIFFENCSAERGLEGWYCVPGTPSNNIQLINCESGSCDKGFNIQVSNHGALINCRASDNGSDGIVINKGVVYGCWVYGNARYGILICGGSGATVLHNTVYGNGYGLAIDSTGGNCLAFNNIFWGNSDNDIDDRSCGTIHGDHNCYDPGKINGYNSGGHDITDDPQFMDAEGCDFSLKVNSVCLNAAITTMFNGFSNLGAWQKKQIVNIPSLSGTLIR